MNPIETEKHIRNMDLATGQCGPKTHVVATTTPEPILAEIPPRIQSQLNDLERIRQSHPDVLAFASSLRFGDTRLIVHWGRHSVSQAEMVAFAVANPDANWKPRASYKGSSDLDWIGTLHGVTVELDGAQTLPIEVLPARVDLASIKPALAQQLKEGKL